MKTAEVEAIRGALEHIGLAADVEVMAGEATVKFTVPRTETEEQCRWMLDKVSDISKGYYAMNIDVDVGGETRAGIRIMKNKLDAAALRVV